MAIARRAFLQSAGYSASALLAGAGPAAPRQWPLGINTYCLRFLKLNDRQLITYCEEHKLDAIFLQDSLDPEVMNAGHWTDVRNWTRQAGLSIETGGGMILPREGESVDASIRQLRRHIERARAMGSTIVRAVLAADRYAMPASPVETQVETALGILKAVRSQALDAGLKIGIENHKDLNAWQTRELIVAAGTDFVGSYLDTGNPVFVAEDPLTTVEELGPYAVTFHLRDSVVYETRDGVAVQWVPLGEGTVDFRALLRRAAELLPAVRVYCKPITARPPVVIPVYSNEFWSKWFPRGRARDLSRFVALARRGQPWDKPHLMADVPAFRERYMEALKSQQTAHMEQSLAYCKTVLDLGVRWRT